MIRPERRGNAIVSFMKASVAKCIREQPDIIQAKPVGIEGGAVYMKHASQTGELILMSLRPWRDIERRKRSEEHTSELQSLMRNSYAVFCLQKKQKKKHNN